MSVHLVPLSVSEKETVKAVQYFDSTTSVSPCLENKCLTLSTVCWVEGGVTEETSSHFNYEHHIR